jgi:hypothetical protein
LHASRSLATFALVGVGLLGLAACAPSPAPIPESTQTDEIDQTDETDAASPTTEEGQPEWALPATTDGDKIATIEAGGVLIEVYQVAVTQATKTGQFVTPEGEPVISVGDDIVFINYVITNTGDPIDLGYSLVLIDARYDDWPYLQGMDSVVDRALFEEVGVYQSPMGPDSYYDPGVYPFGTGESYSYGQNFLYQSGSPITFKVSVTPVDSEGELLHDLGIDVEGSGTIS